MRLFGVAAIKLNLNLNLYVAGPFSVDATGRELGE